MNEREDEVAHAGAIRHDERAQHRALEAALAHHLQPPEHHERRGDEQRQKSHGA